MFADPRLIIELDGEAVQAVVEEVKKESKAAGKAGRR